MEIGTVCIKTAGRDAGKKCVVVDVLEKHFVLIDGETRRKKCNLLHLEPTAQSVKIKKGASHEDVVKVFKSELNIELKETKPRKASERPRTQRTVKAKPEPKVKKQKAAAEEKTKAEEKPAAKKAKAPKKAKKTETAEKQSGE